MYAGDITSRDHWERLEKQRERVGCYADGNEFVGNTDILDGNRFAWVAVELSHLLRP